VANSERKSLVAKLGAFLEELQRRKVVQTTTVYLVAAWGISAGAADIFGALHLPEWAARYLVIAIFAMTPLVAMISWLYEINRQGIHRDYGPAEEQVSRDTAVLRRDDRPALTLRYGEQSATFHRDVVVGRDESCSFQVIEPLISRRHLTFEYVDGRWRLRDLGSANGTRLNGREVEVEWLESAASVVLYPNGPVLQVSIASEAADRQTQVAPSAS